VNPFDKIHTISVDVSKFVCEYTKDKSHPEIVAFFELLRMSGERNISEIKSNCSEETLKNIIGLQNILRKGTTEEKFNVRTGENFQLKKQLQKNKEKNEKPENEKR